MASSEINNVFFLQQAKALSPVESKIQSHKLKD